MSLPAIEADCLTLQYPDSPAPALRELTVSIPRGETVALTGPNGAGKTTLLRAIAGDIRPVAGRLLVAGGEPGDRRNRLALLPQRGEIDWSFPMRLQRFVLAGTYRKLGWLRQPRRAEHEQAEKILTQMGLEELGLRPIGALSGGQQQRALLARALLLDADLYLLDEPSAAIDEVSRQQVFALLKELRAAGKTLFIATHEEEEIDFDRVLRLDRGTMQEEVRR